MPAYPWLFRNILDGKITAQKMRALQTLGVPYSDEHIENARVTVAGKTEAQALIAYLQNLGLDMQGYGESM